MAAIRELIDRMKHDDFHKARAEAKQVTDLGALEEIKAILESTEDRTDKLYCYWILGDLGRNAKAPQVADYLMKRPAPRRPSRVPSPVPRVPPAVERVPSAPRGRRRAPTRPKQAQASTQSDDHPQRRTAARPYHFVTLSPRHRVPLHPQTA